MIAPIGVSNRFAGDECPWLGPLEQDADANACDGANGPIRRASIIRISDFKWDFSKRALSRGCRKFSKNLKIFRNWRSFAREFVKSKIYRSSMSKIF